MNAVERIFRSLIAGSIILAAIVSCGRKNDYHELTGYAQGGTYSVRFSTRGVKTGTDEIKRAVDSILTMVDTTLSGYNKGSQLSRYNAGAQVEPNGMFREIFTVSKRLYEETGGALDMASGPLFNAWGFGFTSDSMPSARKVDSLRAVCGMDKLDDRMLPLDPRIRPGLNFNSIAQGYTCDKIAGYLHSLGVKDMLVNIGEIYCEGVNPSGKPWTIGVDMPEDGNMELGGAGLVGIWQGDGSGWRGHIRQLPKVLRQGRSEIFTHRGSSHGLPCQPFSPERHDSGS